MKEVGHQKWQALCPAHNDKNPSLSISLGEKDQILLHCFAGCSYAAILEAIGLSKQDLYPCQEEFSKSKSISKGEPITLSYLEDKFEAVYKYRDAEANLSFLITRSKKKKFTVWHQIAENSFKTGLNGNAKIPYNLPKVNKALPGDTVFICEGEKDANTLNQAGLLASTTPFGCKGWKKVRDKSCFAGKRIVIIHDLDPAGRKYATDIAMDLLSSALEVRILNLAESGFKGNDVTDWFLWKGKLQIEEKKNLLLQKSDEAPIWPGHNWTKPALPKNEGTLLPEFPIHVFPEWLRIMISEISIDLQTPLDLAGCLALAILSLAAGKKYVVRIKESWKLMTNLYIAISMESGTGKTAMFNKMIKPIEEWEQKKRKEVSVTRKIFLEEKDMLRVRLKSLKKSYAKSADEDKSEVSKVTRQLLDLNIPNLPQLTTTDATQEGISLLLSQHYGKIGYFSSEGQDFVSIAAGRYSKKSESNVDVYLNGYSGQTIKINRADRTREPIIIYEPLICIGLCMQPCTQAKMWAIEDFRDRGLLARFLWSVPKDLVGKRVMDVPPVKVDTLNRYNSNVAKLLEICHTSEHTKPQEINLSDKSRKYLYEYKGQQEPEYLEGGQLNGSIKTWALRLPGKAAKIAGLLKIATDLEDEQPSQYIEISTLKNAIELCDYFLKHYACLCDNVNIKKEESLPSKILNKIETEHLQTFSTRDIYRPLGKSSEETEKALQLLKISGFVRKNPVTNNKSSGPGRKHCDVWLVNPSLLTTHINSVNSVNSAIGG